MFELLNKNKQRVRYVASKELQDKINIWLRKAGLKNISFGTVLFNLGFDLDEVIYLSECSKSGNISFNYSKIKDQFNHNDKITLFGKTRIELCGAGFKKGYDSIIRDGKLELDKVYDQCDLEAENDISYFHNILKGRNKSEIYIEVKYEDIEKYISLNIKYKEHYSTDFAIDNELQKYLMNLTFPVEIEEVYKKICEILADDMNKYGIITLKSGNIQENAVSKCSTLRSTNGFTGNGLEIVKDGKQILYLKHFSASKVEMDVWNGDYKFYISVTFKDFESLDDNNCIKKLDNEVELRDYLMNLSFPVSIEEVYKKVCEISLGDVSEYSRIVLQCYNKSNGITDLVILNDGHFEKFGMTKNGKTIFIDNLGNFTYSITDTMTDISVKISADQKTKCEINSKNGKSMDDYLDSLVSYDISNARKEKEDVKRLVRKIFDDKKNGSN